MTFIPLLNVFSSCTKKISNIVTFEDIIYWNFLKNHSLFHMFGTEAFEAPWNTHVLSTARR